MSPPSALIAHAVTMPSGLPPTPTHMSMREPWSARR